MKEILMGRYDVIGEMSKVKAMKEYFLEKNPDYIPVLSGEFCEDEYEKILTRIKQNDIDFAVNKVEFAMYEKTTIEARVTDNLVLEVVKISHDERGDYLYLEKCKINEEFVGKNDIDELTKII